MASADHPANPALAGKGYLQLSEAVAEAERALRSLACPVARGSADFEALRAVEARLRVLLVEVGRRLHAHRGEPTVPTAAARSPKAPAAPPLFREPSGSSVSEGSEVGPEAISRSRRSSMPPELPSEAKDRGSAKLVDEGPDALEEWYTDPWAMGGPGSPAEPLEALGCAAGEPEKRDSYSPSARRSSAELFSMEHDTDLDTEVDDTGMSRSRDLGHVEDLANESDRANDPHWQYGRCVCQKIVALSPLGSSAFEQMLIVLMTVFELSEQQRDRALKARRKAASRSKGGWSKLFSVPEGEG